MTVVDLTDAQSGEVGRSKLRPYFFGSERGKQGLIEELPEKRRLCSGVASDEIPCGFSGAGPTKILHKDCAVFSGEPFHLEPERDGVEQVVQEAIRHHEIDSSREATNRLCVGS